MKTNIIEMIAFLWLVILTTGCASSFKDISLKASVDFEKDGMKEELDIEGKF
jgi:hypothetical protein